MEISPFFQTMQEALRSRQGHMDQLNAQYADFAITTRQAGANVPEPMQHRIDKLNVDWLKVQQMSTNLRPTSGDDSVFTEGKESVIIYELGNQ